MVNCANPIQFREIAPLRIADRNDWYIAIVLINRIELGQIQPTMHCRNRGSRYQTRKWGTPVVEVRMDNIEVRIALVDVAKHPKLVGGTQAIEPIKPQGRGPSRMKGRTAGRIAGSKESHLMAASQ